MKDILKKDKLNIIIASTEDIEFLIKNSISLEKVKYLPYQEVIDDFLGSYTFDAFLDLNLTKGFTFSNAKILLNNSLLLTNNEKKKSLSNLLEIKQNYSEYLKDNDLNLEKYNNANIILYNYYAIDDLFYKALQKLTEKFIVIKYYSKEQQRKNIYFNEYLTIDKEIKDLTYKVAKLLHNKTPSEDIVIINNNNEYNSLLRSYFNLANISLSDEAIPLLHFRFVKKIINDVFDYANDNLFSSFNYVVNNHQKFSNNETKLIKELSKIISSLTTITLQKDKLKELVFYLLYKKTITLNKYTNVINIENNFNKTYKHVFMVGLNDENCSYKYKDNEFISDDDRLQMNLLTSLHKNSEYEKKIKGFLKTSANYYISYSVNTKSGIKQKPSILNSFAYQEYKIDNKVTYSKNIDELQFKILLEQYKKYHEESQELYDLAGNYKDVENKVYNNKFSGINEILINNQLDKGLVLSYTSIDEYYQCAFRFYIRRILKINKITDEDPLIIGNLFHHVLSLLNQKEFDYEEIINNYLIENAIDTSGYLGHFINKYIKHFKILIPYIKEFHEDSKFEVSSLEEKYEVIIDNKYNIKLKGFIDKVMSYDYLNKKYFLVIDYKTGNAKIDFRNVIYGLDMQLLIYFYMISKQFPNYGFGASYLQRLLPTSLATFEKGKQFDDQFKKSFALEGYSNNDFSILTSICENIDEGDFVNGIKFLKGTTELQHYAKNRTFSEDDFDKLLKLTEKKILEAKNNILKANFMINPKKGNGNDSCIYCPYKDICYKTESDYVKLDDVKDYSFLEDK